MGTGTKIKTIKFKNIPTDIEEYYDLDDISFQGDDEFDDVMIERGYFEYGGTRRSHRCVTEKFKKTKYEDFIADVTGVPYSIIEKELIEIAEQKQLDELFYLAEKFNYKLVKETDDKK